MFIDFDRVSELSMCYALIVSSCCATQSETKWQTPGRRAKKYGPATISDVQIAVSEVLGRLRFNTAAFRGCWNGA